MPTTDPVPIYRAALADVLASIGDTVAVAIESATQSPSDADPEHFFRAIGVSRSLTNAHRLMNNTSVTIDAAVAQALNVDYGSPDSLTNPSAMYGAWTSAYDRYTYVIVLSQPAVSRWGETAIVHYWVGCGALCGHGYVSKLELVGDRWTVVADSMYMVS